MFVSLALEVKSRSFLLVNANNSLPVSLATTVKTNLQGTESSCAEQIFYVPHTEREGIA